MIHRRRHSLVNIFGSALVQLLLDTFTGSAGTELSAHTPDTDPGLGAYDELSGDWELVAGNKLGLNTTAGIFLIDIGASIGYSKIDNIDTSSNNPAVIFNGIDIDNFWMLQARDDGSDDIRLLENTTAGGLVVRATAVHTIGATITLKLERVSGNVLKGYADDMNVPVLSYASSLHDTGTKIGIRSNVATQEFDQFEGWG